MQISCHCDRCGAHFKVGSHLAGKKGRCNKCKAVFLIPAEEKAASSAEPQANSLEHHDQPPPLGESPIPTAIPFPSDQAIPTALPVPSENAATGPAGTEDAGGLQPGIPVAQPVSAAAENPAPLQIQNREGSYAARTSKKRNRRRLIATLLGVACVMICVAGLVLFQSWLAFQTAKTGLLVVKVPPDQTNEVVILVDDDVRVPDSTGRLIVRLPPGKHKLQLRRLGFNDIRDSVNITAGIEFEYHPLWQPESAGDEDG